MTLSLPAPTHFFPHGAHFRLEVGGVYYPFTLPHPHNYRVSDLSPFTQRTASGGLTLQDFAHYAAFEQRTFNGGMGQSEMIEAARYWYGDGVDTRIPGLVSMWTKTEQIFVVVPIRTPCIESNEVYVFFAGTGGIRAWDGFTLTNIGVGLPNSTIYALLWNGTNLFVGVNGGSGVNGYSIHRFTGSVSVPAWTAVNTNVHKARAFAIHNGHHWYAQDDSNLIHYGSLADMSDMEANIRIGDGTDLTDHPLNSPTGDVAAVIVGPNGREVKRLVSFNGLLYAFRDDGMWEVRLELASDNTQEYVAYKVIDFIPHPDNGMAVTTWNGAMWFYADGRLWRYTGGTQTDWTPPPYTDGTTTFPPVKHLPIHALCGGQGFLWALCAKELYAFDGTGWHHMKTATTSEGSGTDAAIHYWGKGGRLYALYTHEVSNTLYWWRLTSEFSGPPYDDTADGVSFYTSWFDGGFVDVDKYWVSLKLYGFIPSPGGSITVEATTRSERTSTAVVVGPMNEADVVNTRAIRTFEFPTSFYGKDIRFKFTLKSDAPTQSSPQVLGYLLEYVPRPVTVYGFNATVLLADNMMMNEGQNDPYTAREKLKLLEDARDSVTPLRFEDFMGHRAYVYVSAISEVAPLFHPDNEDQPEQRPEFQVTLSLVSLDRCAEVDIPTGLTAHETTPYDIPCQLRIEGTLIIE